MSSLHLSSLALEPISPNGNDLRVMFHTSSLREADPLYPATGLQVAFCHGETEAYTPERLVAREVDVSDDGTCSILVAGMPRFAHRNANPEARTLVKVHAWKGEKLLGSWVAGSVKGREIER
jgi:hypothetical protein